METLTKSFLHQKSLLRLECFVLLSQQGGEMIAIQRSVA